MVLTLGDLGLVMLLLSDEADSVDLDGEHELACSTGIQSQKDCIYKQSSESNERSKAKARHTSLGEGDLVWCFLSLRVLKCLTTSTPAYNATAVIRAGVHGASTT